jgi:hypothetical protein
VNPVFEFGRFAFGGLRSRSATESKWFQGLAKESWWWCVEEQFLKEVRVKPEAIEGVVS